MVYMEQTKSPKDCKHYASDVGSGFTCFAHYLRSLEEPRTQMCTGTDGGHVGSAQPAAELLLLTFLISMATALRVVNNRQLAGEEAAAFV